MASNLAEMSDISLSARKRLIQMHFEAGAGHLGGNLSCLDLLLTLHHRVMSINDHLILSKGHSAGALYVSLWSQGKLGDDDLATFHKDDTLLAGHPMAKGLDDVVFGTGSLGHGFSLAAGMAMGLRLQGKNDKVFCVCSDGEWQEGSTWEALIFAAHSKLDNLTVLIDANGLQGFGNVNEVASMQDLEAKISSFNVDVARVDGHDFEALETALNLAMDGRTRIIVCDTVKGKAVADYENKMESHYLPLRAEQYDTAIASLSSNTN